MATCVHSQKDLLPQFKAGNDFVFAVVVDAPNQEVASAYAYQEAFFAEYAAYDSVSELISIDDSFILPSHVKYVKVKL